MISALVSNKSKYLVSCRMWKTNCPEVMRVCSGGQPWVQRRMQNERNEIASGTLWGNRVWWLDRGTDVRMYCSCCCRSVRPGLFGSCFIFFIFWWQGLEQRGSVSASTSLALVGCCNDVTPQYQPDFSSFKRLLSQPSNPA